jgi:putative ABC transport system permease protein
MNLAIRDLRLHWGRFVLSCLGVGLLLTLVLSYGGIYNGFVADALALIDSSGADLWVVQKDTRGPFAEQSRLPADTRYRIAVVPGVRATSPYIFYTVQRPWRGRMLRFVVVGYDLGSGMGGPARIVAGRGIAQAHYEMVADQKLGLRLGDKIPLGLNEYTVVGITRGMVGSGGDPAVFFSYQDAQDIQFAKDNWAIRNTRHRALAAYTQALPTQPALAAGLSRRFADNPDLHNVNAVLVRLAPGAEPAKVAASINRWEYYTASTTTEQTQLMLTGPVTLAKRQTGLFRVLLTIVTTVILAQIIYTMTLDKLKPIALLKLIGAPNRLVMGLVLQQSFALGLIGYVIALILGNLTYDKWPRRVIVGPPDQLFLLGIVVGICLFASIMGVRRALRVEAGAALTG